MKTHKIRDTFWTDRVSTESCISITSMKLSLYDGVVPEMAEIWNCVTVTMQIASEWDVNVAFYAQQQRG